VRAAVQELVTSEVDAALKHLPGPLRSGLAGLAVDGVGTFMASAAFQSLWVTVNRFAILRARSTSERRTNLGVGVLAVAIGAGIAVS
jgi:hypothetical protein